MQLANALNLTISRIQHHLFGAGRFEPSESRRASFSPRRVGSIAQHSSQRLRRGTPLFRPAPARESVNRTAPRESWPYDTAFPTALPKVAVLPGHQLTDMPSTGAQLAKSRSTDNLLSGSLSPVGASGKPGTADHLGTIIDVFA